MHSLKFTIRFFLTFLVLLLFVASSCNSHENAELEPTNRYLNWGDSAEYVGIEVCAQCHLDQHKTFVHTGMGQSFGSATQQKSSGKFDESNFLYDSAHDFSYYVGWSGDSLFVHELRMKGQTNPETQFEEGIDILHKRAQKVDYIVGSGQHTNSHIFSEKGYLYQAPFTFYTQTGVLDFPPGFEGGNNSRFDRPIGLECMSCHNAMPTGFVLGSENKFENVPMGIDCERCHGPGSLHVNRLQRGLAVDTAVEVDWSIVNPKRLSSELQFELCQRCHLQGNTVLAAGRSFFDFKPGMRLDSIMDVFLPRYENADDQFIMASHADRFQMSKCYKTGEGSFSCTSCHNPHVSVKETNTAQFNKSCEKCHGGLEQNYGCTKVIKHLDPDQFNCVKCHMPKSGSIDIPHVSVHDHNIQIPQKDKKQETERGRFLGLQAVNNPNPTIRNKTRAYLQQFERFEANPVFLDSASHLLQNQSLKEYWQENIHLFYLRNESSNIVKLIEENGGVETWLQRLEVKSYANEHAWTAHRIADAYKDFGDFNTALLFADKAVYLAPFHPEFRLKQGSIYALRQEFGSAENIYLEVNAQNSLIAESWSNLGYVQMAQSKFDAAEKSLITALALNPDYGLAKLNLASVYLATDRFKDARELLENILKEEPENERVKAALEYLNAEKL